MTARAAKYGELQLDPPDAGEEVTAALAASAEARSGIAARAAEHPALWRWTVPATADRPDEGLLVRGERRGEERWRGGIPHADERGLPADERSTARA